MGDENEILKTMGFGEAPSLLVVDMTNEFVMDKYRTGYSKTGIPCANAISKLLREARLSCIPVFFTRPVFNTRIVCGRWLDKTSMVPHTDAGSSAFYKNIKPSQEDVVIEKNKPSAFFGTQLASMLNLLRIDTVIVTGMTTSGCVRASVVDAFSYNLKVIIPKEAVADRVKSSHEASLYDMSVRYADVMRLDDVLNAIRKHEPRSQQ